MDENSNDISLDVHFGCQDWRTSINYKQTTCICLTVAVATTHRLNNTNIYIHSLLTDSKHLFTREMKERKLEQTYNQPQWQWQTEKCKFFKEKTNISTGTRLEAFKCSSPNNFDGWLEIGSPSQYLEMWCKIYYSLSLKGSWN